MIMIRSLTMIWSMIVLMVITRMANAKRIDVNQLQMAAMITSALPKTRANYIMSPLNIDVGLSTIYKGIENATCSAQLKTLLGNNTDEDANNKSQYIRTYANSDDKNITLSFLNAIFHSSDTEILPEYKKKDLFNTNFSQINFSDSNRARQTINELISSATNGMIQNAVNSIKAQTKFMSVNVLFFKALWEKPFTRRLMDTFFGAGGINKSIPMMVVKSNVSYYKSVEHKFSMISKPYEANHFQMVLLLPNYDSNINDLEKSILQKPHIINDGLRESNYKNMFVTMPVIMMEETMNIKELLETKNITCIFKGGINKLAKEPMSMSDITHKVKFETNENGSRGSAVLVFAYRMAVPTFKVNRPYMFMVVDTDTGYILFMGKQTIPN